MTKYWADILQEYINNEDITQEQKDSFIAELKLLKDTEGTDFERACKALINANVCNTENEVKLLFHGCSLHPMPKVKAKVSFDPLSNVEAFYDDKPFFYDRSRIFWLWDSKECRYEIVDEVDIMNEIEESLGLYGQTIGSKIKAEYLEAFKRIGRKKIPKETPVKWIQFKNKAYSLESGHIYDVTPDYFFTNPIPWELGQSEDTPTLDKLFNEWVGEDYVQDLYEIISYCCYRSYPIQTFICLHGTGRNGKSQYLKVINKFLGISNICSTELDLLAGSNSSRFEVFKLYKKLACMLGETNFGILTTTSILKKLVGGDVIGFEKKGKDPFDDYNYAKVIIASNSLPSSEDTSDGYMRRWHIINFPNEFSEGKDIISTIPEIEYRNLAKKITKILPELIKAGAFKNQGTIDVRKHNYMMASNPLPIFLKDYCEKNPDYFESYNKLYTEYVKYLIHHKKRKVKVKEFKGVLENEGFYVEKTALKINNEWKSGYYVIGLRLVLDILDNFHLFPTQNPIGELIGKGVQNVQNVQNNRLEEENSSIIEEIVQSPKEIVLSVIASHGEISLGYMNGEFDSTIKQMAFTGELFEFKAGVYKVLQ